METRYQREKDGWHGRTTIPLEEKRVLTVRTGRSSFDRTLISTASVSTERNGFMVHVMGNGAIGDFYKAIIKRSLPRITEKSVREQHEMALAYISEIQWQAIAHYKKSQSSTEPSLGSTKGT